MADETALLGSTLDALVGEGWLALEAGGFTRVGIPEAAGGAGGTRALAAIVLERSGWAGVDGPVAETMVAGWLCAAAGLQLPPGPATVVIAGHEDRVAWASRAEHLVVAAPHPGGLAVSVVPAASVLIVPGRNLAGEQRDRVTLAVEPDAVVPEPDLALRLLAAARAVVVGGAVRRAVELVRSHVGERVQFGKPIGTFQHVRLVVADLAERAALAGGGAEGALVQAPDPTFMAAASAWIVASRVATDVAAGAHQLLGAIGFTDEHPLHRTTTRLWAWRDELGGTGWWEQQLGGALLEAGPDALWPAVADR